MAKQQAKSQHRNPKMATACTARECCQKKEEEIHSSKYAKLHQCKDSVTTKITSLSIRNYFYQQSEECWSSFFGTKVNCHGLAMPTLSPLREGDHIQITCLMETVSVLWQPLYYAYKSSVKIFSSCWSKAHQGECQELHRMGEPLLSIPQPPFTRTEIIFKVISLPKQLQNQNYQQKFLQYFVDHQACLYNEQKHAALYLCPFLFLST